MGQSSLPWWELCVLGLAQAHPVSDVMSESVVGRFSKCCSTHNSSGSGSWAVGSSSSRCALVLWGCRALTQPDTTLTRSSSTGAATGMKGEREAEKDLWIWGSGKTTEGSGTELWEIPRSSLSP